MMQKSNLLIYLIYVLRNVPTKGFKLSRTITSLLIAQNVYF